MTAVTSIPALALVGCAALVLSLVKVYKTYTNPLSNIPGSELSKWTDLGWWLALVRFTRVSTQHANHLKYGSVVRIAPNEVLVSDPQAVHQIYSISSGFLKSQFYTDFTRTKENDTMFSMRNPHYHQHRRRLLGQSMSETYLRSHLEPFVHRLVSLMVKRMQEQLKNEGRFDPLRWLIYMTTDVIGDLTFGDSFRMLELGKDNQYINDVREASKAGGINAAFPVLSKFILKLPFGFIKEALLADVRVVGFARQSIDRYRKAVEADPNMRPTLFSKMWDSNDSGQMTDEQLAMESQAYLVAGTDTTSVTLTYMIWELARHPEWQRKISDEMAALPEPFSAKDLASLPNLQLVRQETLRLHGPVQNSLPRVVPPQGMTANGHFLPGGTVVHGAAYTLHRNEDAFPDAESWRPERWEKPTQAMNDLFFAWGGGSRACIGRNLAVMEMNLTMAELYRSFPNGLVDAGTPDEDMRHTEVFISAPRGEHCWVKPL